MSPQDYSTLAGPGSLSRGPGSIEDVDSELMALVGRIVCLYSAIDTEAMNLAATCLGHDFLLSSRLLEEFKGKPGGRVTILKVAAEGRFRDQPDDWGLVDKVIRRVNAAYKVRDPFVHWVWMVDGNRPDILVLVPPENFVQTHGVIRAAEATGIVTKQVKDGAVHKSIRPTRDFSGHYVPLASAAKYYTKKELEGYVDAFLQTLNLLWMADELAGIDPDEADLARRQLANQL